ncbi:MAG: response regulator, partial [Desulfurivibrio sp.]
MHHLLLVEDNSADAALIRAMVEEIETVSQFTHCQRLQEALRYLTAEDCCLVLLDLNLPDSEGLATLNDLRSVNPRVPVVVLTGLDDQTAALA